MESPAARNCAVLMLELVPGLMQMIRGHMRRQRLPGMSVPQFRALAFVDIEGKSTLSAVAEHVGTTLPSMSRMIQSLVCEEMVRRGDGLADRRTVCLEVTDKGRQFLKIARKAAAQQMASQIGTLSGDEVAALAQAIASLKRLLPARVRSSARVKARATAR